MKKAIIYTRVSSQDQIENTSLHNQLNKCTIFAQLKNLKIINHYSDKGFSGKNFNRPSFKLLTEKMDTYDVIICYSLDRFSRSTFELLKIIKTFKKKKKEIYFLNPMIDLSSKYGEFFVTILSAIAQLERNMIIERTQQGIKERLKQGKPQNRIPFGYNKNCTINKRQANIIKKIFSHKIKNPKKPVLQLSKEFKIANSSINLILRNEFYVGYIKYNKKLIKGQHKAIISKKDFYKMQEILKGNTLKPITTTPSP